MPPIRRGRRRPVAKAAVVGGAVHAGRKSGERKAQNEAVPDQAEPAGAAKADDSLDQLKKLGELRDSGVLTDEEFEAKKSEILGG